MLFRSTPRQHPFFVYDGVWGLSYPTPEQHLFGLISIEWTIPRSGALDQVAAYALRADAWIAIFGLTTSKLRFNFSS
jgi:hypothetical protein